MASISITTSTPVTTFSSTTGLYSFGGNSPLGITLTERTGSENTSLDVPETLDGISALGPSTADYQGFITVGGNDYPVFISGDGSVLVVGVVLDSATYPNYASVSAVLNTTDSFTDFAAVCFAAGTGIATSTGRRAVETLGIGDTILTADGGTTIVKWIGVQRIMPRFGAPDRRILVRISAGALGDGLPERDLRVTGDHALFLDGLLVNAGALINGTTIAWDVPADDMAPFTIYHIETEAHDIVLAEGAATETYIDYVGRHAFDNYAEYLALYGEDVVIAEHAAPRISSARLLPPALRVRLGIACAA